MKDKPAACQSDKEQEIKIILGSKDEVDFSLIEKDGHIIASFFHEEDFAVPGGYFLYSINDHPMHGASGTFLKDVKEMIECPDSYPITLVFKSEACHKSKKKLTLPVPDDFLGEIPKLSEAEIIEYMELAKSWAPNLLEAAKATEGFKFVKRQDEVDIYIGTQSDKKIQLVRGSTLVKCTKDEMRAFMISHTTDSFRRLFHMIDVNFVDGLMLHQFPSGYKHPNVPFFSIKWAIIGQPGPIWSRDVCWLEYGDIVTDDDGKEVGFGVGSSVSRPECPPMDHYHLVRADLMCTGYVFRPSDDADYMEVTYVMQADPKGWIPTWAVSLFAWQEALNLARIRKHAEGIHSAQVRMSGHERQGAAVQGVFIPHGKQHTIALHVSESDASLTFGFCTASHDVGFHITGLAPEGEKWGKNTRYHTNEDPVYGKVRVKQGDYQLVFDNSYSWFKAKQVYYWFNLAT
ncbi:uncharacterized protein LOC116617779 [Nematostella vectensis]|uniref:uncharacterized protein LOC116617779 n=1 Tax=Nematostella vectensis TaxID=45351 RepID=UPI00138FA963|nr:uncharacterized protein LOC116617779 [Nematostella vectensis]